MFITYTSPRTGLMVSCIVYKTSPCYVIVSFFTAGWR